MWFADLDTETISDTGSSTTVLVVTLLLVAFGVGLAVVTAWFWRQTAPDPDALGPLSVMSRRRFVSLGAIEQRRLMDEARPGYVPTTTTKAGKGSHGDSESDDSESADSVDQVEQVDDSNSARFAGAPGSHGDLAGPARESEDDLFDDDDDLVHEAFEERPVSDEPSDEWGADEPGPDRPQRFIDPLLGR
jgi:hypothetical protein